MDNLSINEHLQADTSTGSVSHLVDHLGSTSQLLDSTNGSAMARYDYKSYGRLEGDVENPVASNAYTYTGREDDGTGLMYYRARYYDPELEVFISQDPLGDAQRYVGGNPLSFVDPLGLAYFAKRNIELEGPFHIKFPLPFSKGISYGNKYLDLENIELQHEHIFFEDNKIPTNVGYGPGGLFFNQNPKDYHIKSIHYDDSILRKALSNVVKTGNWKAGYNVTNHNYQDFAQAVKQEYERIKR